VIGADIPHTDVVTHDDDDVGVVSPAQTPLRQHHHGKRKAATIMFLRLVYMITSFVIPRNENRKRAIPTLRHDMVVMRE
jgi:hypothetical protein